MKRPLAGVAALFALGILLGVWLPLLLGVLFSGLFLSGVAVLVPWRGEAPALGLCLVLAGWTHVTWLMAPLAPDDLRRIVNVPETLATLRGRLELTPELRVQRRAGRAFTNAVAVLVGREIGIGSPERWTSASGRVAVSAPFRPDDVIRAGAEVEITGVLRRPRGPQAPGTFDHASWLRWQGIEFELRANEPSDWRLAPGFESPAWTWVDRFQHWAGEVLTLGLDPSEEETQLLKAMTLGWRTGLTNEVDEPFMRSGTMHIFAISGLHIALIAAIAGQVLRLLPLPRAAIGVGVIALCWAYTLATGVQPSAVRSTLMITAVIGGRLLARPSNVLNSLAAAAIAVLVWDPRQLFQAGFQLSFAVVAMLGLLGTPIRDWLARLAAPDPLLAPSAVPWWRRQVASIWAIASGSIAVATASWLGSVPLSAEHFHLLTFSGFLANLIVVPLSSCALAGNVASLVCGAWLPGASELFNHASWLFMRGMLEVSRRAAWLPGGCWNVASPPVAASVLWYLLLLATGLGWWRNRRPRIALVAGSLALAGLAVTEWRLSHDPMRLVVIPLGTGHAVWVRDARGDSLIDTGDAASAEAVTVPFLRAQGVNSLRTLGMTHGDIHHVGGVSNVLARIPARRIVRSSASFRSVAWRAAGERCAGIPEFGDEPATASGGSAVETWRVYHPARGDTFSRADDGCLVVGFTNAGTSVLLLGDLDRRGQRLLAERHNELRTGLLILAPPGSGSPPDTGLVTRLAPRLVVVADAARPATARAKPEFGQALAAAGRTVLFTAQTGSLDLRWDGRRWRALDAAGRELWCGP